MPRESPGSYEVGYGKPPRNSQFRKGQSGNPRGGRSGAASLARSVSQVMRKKLSITENGRRRRLSAMEAIVMAQAQKALKGDHRAAKLLLDLQQALPVPEPTPSAVSQAKDRVWTRFLKTLDVDTLMKVRMALVEASREEQGGGEDE